MRMVNRTSRRCGRKDRAWPILYTNFLLRCLVDSVAVFARVSFTITSITLDGIPLAPKYLNILCCGLKNNETLRNLSLTKCRIGDVGCNLLLGCLRNVPNLSALNLSSCQLTNRSAMFLSLFLKGRKADLLQNVWERSSLRSCEEDSSDKKPQGLHTLILSQNPKFGDNGVRQLMHALKSDFWLKSLTLKRCGITKHGGEIIVGFLQSNSRITKLDLTENRVPINTLQVIFKILKRKRETPDNVTVRSKVTSNWKYSRSKMFKRDRIYEHSKRGSKRSINLSRRRNKRSSRSSNRTIHLERTKQIKRIEDEIRSRNKHDSRREKLYDLESQLLSIIESNCELKEKLSSNKALLDMEAQETLRMENELQKVSLRLNDLRSKVVMLNCVSANVCGESQLLKGLRYVFEKLKAFSDAKGMDDRDEEEEDLRVAEVSWPLEPPQQRRNNFANTLQRRPYCPRLKIRSFF